MSDLLLDVQAVPATPAAGQAVISVNNITKALQYKNDAGVVRSMELGNNSVASQAPAAATRTYITGSNILIPAGGLQANTQFKWRFDMTKTAAGIAASTFDICFGTAGTTADTARVSFTKPAGTAVIDHGIVQINAIVRNVGASAVVVGILEMTHNLAATGHAVIPVVTVVTISAAFDTTAVNNIGVCITSGAADAITIQYCTAEATNV